VKLQISKHAAENGDKQVIIPFGMVFSDGRATRATKVEHGVQTLNACRFVHRRVYPRIAQENADGVDPVCTGEPNIIRHVLGSAICCVRDAADAYRGFIVRAYLVQDASILVNLERAIIVAPLAAPVIHGTQVIIARDLLALLVILLEGREISVHRARGARVDGRPGNEPIGADLVDECLLLREQVGPI